jgi:hypothetical protein
MVSDRLQNRPLIRIITFSAATGLSLPELLDFLRFWLTPKKPD